MKTLRPAVLLRAWVAALLCCALGLSLSTAAAGLQDDRGVAATQVPARRIVVLAPHLAELAYASGAGERLVGAVRFSDFPPPAARLPLVGDASRIDHERVLSLRPDLVLAWVSGNRGGDIARLESLGLPVFATEPRRVTDIPRLMRTIGVLAGTAEAAAAAASAFEGGLSRLRVHDGAAPRVRVFYAIWVKPMVTVSGRHFISDLIELCGGINVFQQAGALTPTVSQEALLAARPDVIIGGSAAEPDAFVAAWRREVLPPLATIPVLFVPPDLIQRPGPRLIDGARALCAQLAQVRALRGVAR